MQYFAGHMYDPCKYQIRFSAMLPEDKILIIGQCIHVPESKAYKFIFMNNRVDEITVGMAINHAINKLNRFIDNYKA